MHYPSEFMSGITLFLRRSSISQSRNAAMGGNRAGVILTIVAPAAPMAMPGISAISSAVQEQRLY